MAKFNQLTEFERERISKMLAAGCSYTEIAAFLGRSISTVEREVYRNCAADEYFADEAHKKALKRQAYSHASKAKIIRNEEMKSLIHAKLSIRRSPKQISQWLLKTHQMQISHETIYLYIYVQTKGELKKELISYLRQRKPRRQSKKLETDKRGTIPDMISIHQRPEEVADRVIPGHWFCDPHSPWQRCTNEKTNVLNRDFWPKGTDFSSITPKQLL